MPIIMIPEAQLDEVVRIAVYDRFIQTGAAPGPATLAQQLEAIC